MPKSPDKVLVGALVRAALLGMFEHEAFRKASVQDAINVAASLLVTLTKHIEDRLTPEVQMMFRSALSKELHRLADGVAVGAFRFDGEAPEQIH